MAWYGLTNCNKRRLARHAGLIAWSRSDQNCCHKQSSLPQPGHQKLLRCEQVQLGPLAGVIGLRFAGRGAVDVPVDHGHGGCGSVLLLGQTRPILLPSTFSSNLASFSDGRSTSTWPRAYMTIASPTDQSAPGPDRTSYGTTTNTRRNVEATATTQRP